MKTPRPVAQTEQLEKGEGTPQPRNVRISVHPLFCALLAVSFFFGRGWEFLITALSAALHEFGHAAAASRRGYALGKITLMPYGALIGESDREMSAKDECAVAVAGPLVSLAVCAAVPALWWLYPDLYPYTECIFLANVSLFFCNLLPVWPLDGSRVLYAFLKSKKPRSVAAGWCKAVGGVVFFTLLIPLALFRVKNITAYLFFAALAPSVFSVGKGEGYRKALYLRKKQLKSGAELKIIAFSAEATLGDAVKKMSGGERYLICVFSGERVSYFLTDGQFYRLAQDLPLGMPFSAVQGYGSTKKKNNL